MKPFKQALGIPSSNLGGGLAFLCGQPEQDGSPIMHSAFGVGTNVWLFSPI